MSAAEDEGHGRRFHSGYKLRYRESGFDIAADGVENYEQAFNIAALFYRDELRNDMLVFCSFILRRQDIVTLYLTDNCQAVDIMPALVNGYRACFDYLAKLPVRAVGGISVLFTDARVGATGSNMLSFCSSCFFLFIEFTPDKQYARITFDNSAIAQRTAADYI